MESLKTILNCEQFEHAGCEAVARSWVSQARGTVIVNGITLKNGGNFTQAVKDNLKEQSLYKNIVKDVITFGIKVCTTEAEYDRQKSEKFQFGGWTSLSMLLYGGNIFTNGLGRKRRDADHSADGRWG